MDQIKMDEWCQEVELDGGIKGYKIKELKDDENLSVEDYLYKDYGIFKLTPRECLRLMAVRDSDIDKMMWIEKEWKGDELLCNAKSKGAIEKQKLTDTETYVLCTTNVFQDMEKTYPEMMKFTEELTNESMQNVSFVIEKLGGAVQKECVTSITKCLNSTAILCTLTKELEQNTTAIIELDSKENTGKYMRIISEDLLNPKKLSIILTLIERITESKIYSSTLVRVNIQGRIVSIEDCGNYTEKIALSNLKMVGTYTRISSSQLYKQAGNSIVVTVLMAIFSQLGIKGVPKWNDLSQKEREKIIEENR